MGLDLTQEWALGWPREWGPGPRGASTTDDGGDDDGSSWPSFWWHGALACCAVLNVCFYSHVAASVVPDADPATRVYQTRLRRLGLPFVLVCGFRSFFPEIYLSRTVWFDSPLNSILLHRGLATVAELCWIGQIALAMSWCGSALPAPTSKVAAATLKVAPRGLFCAICCAEAFSCTGTITTDSFWFLCEESSWVVSFTLFALPCAVLLVGLCPSDDAAVSWRHVRTFSRILLVACCVYVPWGWLSDIPSNYARWRQEVKDHKVYYGFLDGLVDAATERNVSHGYHCCWGPRLLWMSAYFSLGVWSSIELLNAPRPVKTDESDGFKRLEQSDVV